MKPVHEMTSQELVAEAERREANRRAGRPLDAHAPVVDTRTPDAREADDAKQERDEVRRADKQLGTLGFRIINTSQPRHAKYITPGVPDRFYFHRERGIGFAWEAKSRTGRQSPAQHDFQRDMDACGWDYVLGTADDLFTWIVDRRIAVRDRAGNLVTPELEARRTA